MKIRRVEPEDSDAILAWRNDNRTGNMSFTNKIISKDAHDEWFKESLKLSGRYLYIGLIGNQKIGLCRFDVDIEQQESKVSINLNPEFRGKGLASKLLYEGIKNFKKDWQISIIAQIKKENIPSIKLFERCGFKLMSNTEGNFTYRLSQ